MTNLLNFPSRKPVETLDEEDLERFADPSLLLTCFERVQDALETITRGEKIEVSGKTHVILIETRAALSVLFKRRTGGDAKKVSDEHWEVARGCLQAGEDIPDMHIPIDEPQVTTLHPAHFNGQTDLSLACMALNSSERVREAINDTLAVANAQITADAAIEAINVDTALRQLVLRLSGGTLTDMARIVARITGAGSETLQ